MRVMVRWLGTSLAALVLSWLFAGAVLSPAGRLTYVGGWVVLYVLLFGAIWWVTGLFIDDG